MMENFTDVFETPFISGWIILLGGIIMYLFPAKKINYLYGYRTSKSMKSQQTWDFAQHYSALQMIKGAVFMFILSCTGLLFPETSDWKNVIGIFILLCVLVYLFLTTERAIKKKFPNI